MGIDESHRCGDRRRHTSGSCFIAGAGCAFWCRLRSALERCFDVGSGWCLRSNEQRAKGRRSAVPCGQRGTCAACHHSAQRSSVHRTFTRRSSAHCKPCACAGQPRSHRTDADLAFIQRAGSSRSHPFHARRAVASATRWVRRHIARHRRCAAAATSRSRRADLADACSAANNGSSRSCCSRFHRAFDRRRSWRQANKSLRYSSQSSVFARQHSARRSRGACSAKREHSTERGCRNSGPVCARNHRRTSFPGWPLGHCECIRNRWRNDAGSDTDAGQCKRRRRNCRDDHAAGSDPPRASSRSQLCFGRRRQRNC